MRIQCWFACCLLFSVSALGQVTQSMVPQTVEFPSGKLHLKAYFWKPVGPGPFPAVLFNHGSGGADADHTAAMPITQAASVLAPFFVEHGYAFFYPFREVMVLPPARHHSCKMSCIARYARRRMVLITHDRRQRFGEGKCWERKPDEKPSCNPLKPAATRIIWCHGDLSHGCVINV